MGLEDATPEVEVVIARRIKHVAQSCTLTPVLGTTAMYGKISQKLRDCFGLVDLEVRLVFDKRSYQF